MGKRSLVLIIALALAAISAFSVWQYLTTVEDEARAEVQEVVVYRATELIETGTSVADADALIQESTALREAVVFDGSQIVCTGPAANSDAPLDVCGQNPRLDAVLDPINVAAGPISAGQLITSDLFVPPNLLTNVKLSESIPEGKVAIAVDADATAAVGGFVRPGDRVNLVVSTSYALAASTQLPLDEDLREVLIGSETTVETTTPPAAGDDGQPVVEEAPSLSATSYPRTIDFTQTVLQDVEVLAVGADTRPSPLGTGLTPAGGQIVVFEVTPEQAEKIEYANKFADMSLSLIPSGEDTTYTPFAANGIVVDDLFSLIDRIREQFEAAELVGELSANG